MPNGILNIAFDDTVLETSPTWTRIDSDYVVQSITVSRGRSFELDAMNTGTCRIRLVDTDGSFDPTYTGGPFYGLLDPYKQVQVGLPDAAGTSWLPVYRGYVSSWQYELHPSGNMGFVDIECVDLLDLLAGVELAADGSFGDSVTGSGDIVYSAITATTAVQTRITQVLNEVAAASGLVSWPSALRNIYTGNVGLFARTYTTRTSALTVIQEAAEAEFPGGVAAFWASKSGVASFRGRYARFDYTNPDYSVDEWSVGDLAAAVASPTTVVPVSQPLVWSRDKENIYTAASAVPTTTEGLVELTDTDRAGNYVIDDAAAATYGLRTWAAEDLATRNGAGPTTALEETRLFADYYLANYAQPRTRVGTLTVRPQSPAGVHGDATWDLLQGVELGDYLEVTTSHVAGGFTAQPFFVEGVGYTIAPMAAAHPEVTLTLDVSPASYWDSNPFAGP